MLVTNKYVISDGYGNNENFLYYIDDIYQIRHNKKKIGILQYIHFSLSTTVFQSQEINDGLRYFLMSGCRRKKGVFCDRSSIILSRDPRSQENVPV